MGRDKALLPFRGVSLIEIAVAKLREFCSHVSIAGNRDDLARFAPVAHEIRRNFGPAAGIEAGLMASMQPSALFIPVDTPLLPANVLKRFVEVGLEMGAGGGFREFHLLTDREHPAFCMMGTELQPAITALLDQRERKLIRIFHLACAGFNWGVDLKEMYGENQPPEDLVKRWFSNINTPQDFAEAETWAETAGWQPPRLGRMPY